MAALHPLIDQARLDRFTFLGKGSHETPRDGACAMEMASYIAGEPWSDHPLCVCPVISAFMRSWNDDLPDGERTTLLLPLVPRAVGTRGSDALANRRATMAADWMVRVHTPAWLRLAGLTVHADALANLPEIVDFAATLSLRGPLEAAKRDAVAAGAAAGAAAWDAAWDAARAAAGAAAAGAAWAAAGAAAAGAAARAAAWDAAGDAAGDALASTRHELQQSAVALVERMINLTDADLTKGAA